MVNDLLGGGSNGAGMNAAVEKLMTQKIMGEIFGVKQFAEPVAMEARVLGTDPAGSFGVLGVRLMPPTTTTPFPQLLLETNGQLTIRPHHLREAGAFFQSIAEQLETQFAEQQEAAKGMEGYELFGAMMQGAMR